MAKINSLEDIFNDESFGLLNVKPAAAAPLTESERLVASFEGINEFYEKNKREPVAGSSEHNLYARLSGFRANPEKKELLKKHDRFGLLVVEIKEITSLEDIFDDPDFDLFGNDETGIFDLKHVSKESERAVSDFVAKRKPCRDFEDYDEMFKEVQRDLKAGKRELRKFDKDNIFENQFYVQNGLLLLVENIIITQEEQSFGDGKRIRKDGRTRCIFENGTESNMLYRSLAKILYENGLIVTENSYKIDDVLVENFNQILREDLESGFIYVLKSKSQQSEIKSIQNLFKIGFSTTSVEDRIKNASKQATYLMADVELVATFKCYNLNPQKFEQLLHQFFGEVCLNLDVFSEHGQRFNPREWFVVPYLVIEDAIGLIISGQITKFGYDDQKEIIFIKK